MALGAFPIVFATQVAATVSFYEDLGFETHFRSPAEGEPGYVVLRRGDARIGVVDGAWPSDQYARPLGTGPRFEMFVYVEDVDETVTRLRDRSAVLREAADMPWGERIAYVCDPDDNPVALAAPVP
ncbi:VOC family protein [Actinoplanes teichomyceticus]|uniref:Lactoylglutathione lyase n=1 Tax=Actinoplanes teichomyceticus TaxID=1867 RepID=A0A561VLW8_ACTTI|nr:VOC family protein [Actinoplanes teichomyceticus]TWG12616.1 lactoylglutathione lyase [Actinoplanes teichomyceticus]GIF13986.1 extradiol dioxygenase [Actinoplanes teichomyceticus]